MPSPGDYPRTSSDIGLQSGYEPKIDQHVYHPRFWGTWLIVGSLFVVSRLPRTVNLRIGAAVGRLFYLFNKKRRVYTLTNLELCFPHWPVEKRRQLVADHFRLYGQAVVDLGMLWHAKEKNLNQLLEVSGIENWYDAVSNNRSVIIITPHMVATDIAGAMLACHFPVCAMMKQMRNPLLNHYVVKGRTRFGFKLFKRTQGIRKLITGLKNEVACLYIPDQDFGSKSSIFVPFFATQSATLTTLGRLARITDAVVLPLFAHLDPDTGRYRVSIRGPLENFPVNDDYADARKMNAVFEEIILLAPEQYMWTLRWFKTRPNNEPVPY